MRTQAQSMARGDEHQDTYRVLEQTTDDLERVRRVLAANLVLSAAGSPARGPILSHMKAVSTELDRRALMTDPRD
jgi:hypothetical protein